MPETTYTITIQIGGGTITRHVEGFTLADALGRFTRDNHDLLCESAATGLTVTRGRP